MSTANVAPAPVAVEDKPLAPVEPVDTSPAAPEPAHDTTVDTTATAAGQEAHDGATTPPHKKRLPFANLKNKLFHPKSHPASPTTESADPLNKQAVAPAAVEETPTEHAGRVENAPVVEETSAPAAGDEAPTAAAAALDEERKDSTTKKPKSPGVLERVKSFFSEKEKKDKKVKTPTDEMAEPVVEGVSTSAPHAEGPAQAIEPSVTAPEAVALREASTAAAVPVPQVIQPIPEPVTEPTLEQAEAAATAVKPAGVEATESEPVQDAAAPTAAAVGEEKKADEIKFGEAAKTDDKAPRHDLAKLARRLSGKVGGFLGSPKKEKKEKDLIPVVAADESPVATTSQAPKIETAVDESKLGPTAVEPSTKVVEPIAAEPVKVADPITADKSGDVDAVKSSKLAAPIDAPGEELAKDLELKKNIAEENPVPLAAAAA
ncbi:hypothetical protein JCM3770_002981 [Rhodotorula araucariae]